ncbi:MAG TPA: molybdate ABC transporter substrate-binding protein [Myxococcota bacterium]|nr:molybdate ABC transporter substrate-binding protein [Myxococcota bacterium]
MRSKSRLLGWLGVAVCGLALASAVSAKDETVLHVGAAASLREVAEKMGTRFGEIAPGTRVELSFGASSELAAQLRAGASMDVLMSADEEIPRALEKEGLGDDLHPFTGNRLVVVASAEIAGRVKQPSDLAGDAVKHIAMPLPAVPIGRYAREWLTKAGLLRAVEARVVQTENVRATLAAVDSGDADAAIVYATDARVAKSAKLAFEIPPSQQPRIVYVALRARDTKQQKLAHRFLEFVVGSEGQRLLKEAGFSAPGAAAAP